MRTVPPRYSGSTDVRQGCKSTPADCQFPVATPPGSLRPQYPEHLGAGPGGVALADQERAGAAAPGEHGADVLPGAAEVDLWPDRAGGEVDGARPVRCRKQAPDLRRLDDQGV